MENWRYIYNKLHNRNACRLQKTHLNIIDIRTCRAMAEILDVKRNLKKTLRLIETQKVSNLNISFKKEGAITHIFKHLIF